MVELGIIYTKDHTVTVAWNPRQEDLQIIIPTVRLELELEKCVPTAIEVYTRLGFGLRFTLVQLRGRYNL